MGYQTSFLPLTNSVGFANRCPSKHICFIKIFLSLYHKWQSTL